MQTSRHSGDAEISFETQYYLLPLCRPLFTFTSPPADNKLVAKLSPFLCPVSPPFIVCSVLLFIFIKWKEIDILLERVKGENFLSEIC